MKKENYELKELIHEANGLREGTPALRDTPPFTTRNYHFWVREKLIPAVGRRGRNSLYPAKFIYRLMFIRHLQAIEYLSLANIRDLLNDATEETMENVALGKEPFIWRRKDQVTDQELDQYAQDGQVLEAEVEQTGRTFPVGPDARLVVTKEITAQQAKQLSHVAELIKGILESGGGENLQVSPEK